MLIPDNSSKDAISVADIERQIQNIRGHDVLTSPQIAQFYKIEVRALNQTLKRNPGLLSVKGSMFQLTPTESRDARLFIENPYWGGPRRGILYAFTVDGVIFLRYLALFKRHGSDELDHAIFQAFMNKRKRLESRASTAA